MKNYLERVTRLSMAALAILSSLIVVCNLRADSTNCVPLPTGLVSCWRGEGNADDQAGLNGGITYGGTRYARGLVEQAFNFDGSSGYVLVPDAQSLQLTNTLTIELWINPRSAGGHARTAVSKFASAGGPSSYALCLDIQGRACFLVSGDGTSANPGVVYSSSVVATNEWTHIAAVCDGSQLQMFVNGVPETSAVWTNGIFAGIAPLTLGATLSDDSFFDGLIDEASLYRRALSTIEIQGIYYAGAAGKCVAPALHSQPSSQAVMVGDAVSLSVTASGTPPLGFQWSYNGTLWPADYRSAYRTPPLIWCSYALYPMDVSESAVMAQAWLMKTNGYLDLGWNMLAIDDSWAGYRDENGDLRADPLRFPNGLGQVVTNLHNLGFRLMLFLTMGAASPSGMPGCENNWAHDATNLASMGIDAFKIADDAHALDPASIEYTFRQFISALGPRAANIFIQGSYHTPTLPGPWFSFGLNGHYLVGKHSDGSDTYDNFVMTPNDAGFTNMYSILDTSILPFSWMVKPGRYLCGYGLAGFGPKYAYQSQMGICALFGVGASAYSFPMDGSEENLCQTNRVLLGIIQDPAVIPARLVRQQAGAAEVYARPLAVPGQFAVGMINRDPATVLTGTFNATDLGFAANTPLTLFEVFSNSIASADSGAVSVSVDPHQIRLFLVGASSSGNLVMPPYTNFADLPGPTSSSLVLPDVDLGQAGVYSVRVGNAFGSVDASNAVLTVSLVPPTPFSPALGISLSGPNVSLKWPAWATNFVVQTSASMSTESSAWTVVGPPTAVTNNENVVTLPVDGMAQFYRLYRP